MSLERQWKLSTRKPYCSHTGEAFEEGRPFYTAIFWNDEAGEFQREDYTEFAWNIIRDDIMPFSFWRSTFEPPSPENRRNEVVDKDDAESILRHMIEENDPETVKTRYLLALILERKKILVPIDSQDKDGQRYIIYKRRKTEEIFIVVDPNLEMQEIPAIQDAVFAALPF